MRNLKTITFTLLVVAAILSISGSAFSQGLKIAYVVDGRIQQEYKAWQKAEEDMRLEYQSWEEEATNKQTELQELMAEYDKQRLILSEDKRKEKEAQIRTKQESLDAFTRQIFGPGGTAENKQKQLLDPLLETINKAIEAVALEGNYDLVLTMQSGIAYIKPEFDITDKVLEQLEKQEN